MERGHYCFTCVMLKLKYDCCSFCIVRDYEVYVECSDLSNVVVMRFTINLALSFPLRSFLVVVLLLLLAQVTQINSQKHQNQSKKMSDIEWLGK